jgi:membrane dipeptidase
MSLMQRHLFPERSTFRHRWIPVLRAGGVDVQVLPIYSDHPGADAALRISLEQIQAVFDEVDSNSADVALCHSGSEVTEAVGSGRIALILSLEGCPQFTDDPGLLRLFHRVGVRMVSFTHMGRSPLADGSAEEGTGGRLTRLGVETLREMERLGMIMDVSHLSEAGTEHVLELATRPVIASHSGARSVHDHHRNIPDAQLRGIAASGGVIGLNLLPAILGTSDAGNRVMEHLDHLVEVAGADHVGVGGDFIRDIINEIYPADANVSIEGLDPRATFDSLATASDLPVLTAWMLERGYGESDIVKILGGNFLRVFQEVMGIPSPAR